MVQPIVAGTLADPKTAIPDDAVIFGELLGYGAKLAIGGLYALLYGSTLIQQPTEIYHDRRKNWIQEEIVDWARHLDDECTRFVGTLATHCASTPPLDVNSPLILLLQYSRVSESSRSARGAREAHRPPAEPPEEGGRSEAGRRSVQNRNIN